MDGPLCNTEIGANQRRDLSIYATMQAGPGFVAQTFTCSRTCKLTHVIMQNARLESFETHVNDRQPERIVTFQHEPADCGISACRCLCRNRKEAIVNQINHNHNHEQQSFLVWLLFFWNASNMPRRSPGVVAHQTTGKRGQAIECPQYQQHSQELASRTQYIRVSFLDCLHTSATAHQQHFQRNQLTYNNFLPSLPRSISQRSFVSTRQTLMNDYPTTGRLADIQNRCPFARLPICGSSYTDFRE